MDEEAVYFDELAKSSKEVQSSIEQVYMIGETDAPSVISDCSRQGRWSPHRRSQHS